MKKLLFLAIIMIIATSCNENNIEDAKLSGVWVEVNQKTDTLIFGINDGMLGLYRGTEIRDGALLPKYHSGLYMYQITNDSISLQWAASSSFNTNKYYFEADLKTRKIKIGNFFDNRINNGEILTFKKVH